MNAPSLKEEIALTITRVLAAPRDIVFKVWTTPEHLARWWGPKDFTVPSMTADFREGGAWRSCIRSAEGQDYWAQGTYREIVPPSRLVFTFTWEEEDAIDTLITVTFEEVAGGTRLTFQQAPFATVESRDSHAEGWGECMDRLDAYVVAWKEAV
ncbi:MULTISPECIES: SRPBCC family protein [Sinorhizobium]|uniref:Polyketide cyclase n=2 Tax=Sinorhizobium TaxID=28105 RepID=A0A2S3YSN9_9HYPH|nr:MULTISPECIES: SRPBCC domain-containing protein [Sinorhizobium]ASY60344.1 putative glutathione S-transferase-related transmembrane protein [Sinorhizobium sp. CCBAU 05631]AUX80530.1 activator of Hsp90 ATPase 1 family protein [Sinorhizobium fredii]PDT43661.1 SRPBCC domain-containing protein [Sinorhizobium sp. FG01]PDT53595.1 SRPBCC domain-containing protein [Sinorhizobium sp. NG07B]POH29779.1 polyketide cyclase [Sinorhizobium americanum]